MALTTTTRTSMKAIRNAALVRGFAVAYEGSALTIKRTDLINITVSPSHNWKDADTWRAGSNLSSLLDYIWTFPIR